MEAPSRFSHYATILKSLVSRRGRHLAFLDSRPLPNSDAAKTAPEVDSIYQPLRQKVGLEPAPLLVKKLGFELNAQVSETGQTYINIVTLERPTAEVEFVPAHELGHVQQRPWGKIAESVGRIVGAVTAASALTPAFIQGRKVFRMMLPEKGATIAAVVLAAPVLAGASIIGERAGRKIVRRELEFDADKKGIKLTKNPTAAAQLLRAMDDQTRKMQEAMAQQTTKFMQEFENLKKEQGIEILTPPTRSESERSMSLVQDVEERQSSFIRPAKSAWRELQKVHPKTENCIRRIYQEHASSILKHAQSEPTQPS